MRLLSRVQVLARIDIPRSTWYRLRAAGEFPAPVRIGTQAVGWREDDVERWATERGIEPTKVLRDP